MFRHTYGAVWGPTHAPLLPWRRPACHSPHCSIRLALIARRASLDHLARHFERVAGPAPQPPTEPAPPGSDPACSPPQPLPLTPFEQLPAPVLCDLLSLNSVTAPERMIFDAVVRWAEAGGWGREAADSADAAGSSSSCTGAALEAPGGGPSSQQQQQHQQQGPPALAQQQDRHAADDVLHVLSLVRFPLMQPQVRGCQRQGCCE